jgi:hypothetical protein
MCVLYSSGGPVAAVAKAEPSRRKTIAGTSSYFRGTAHLTSSSFSLWHTHLRTTAPPHTHTIND